MGGILFVCISLKADGPQRARLLPNPTYCKKYEEVTNAIKILQKQVDYTNSSIITSEASYYSTVIGKKVRKKTCVVTKRRAPSPTAAAQILANHILERIMYVQSLPSILAPEMLPASDNELRPRHSSGVCLTYTDHYGERQRAPSTPRWGPSSLQRSFRRAIASTVHAAAAVESA